MGEHDTEIDELKAALAAERKRADGAERALDAMKGHIRNFADGVVKNVMDHPGTLMLYEPISLADFARALADERVSTQEERSGAASRGGAIAAVIRSGGFQFMTSWVYRGEAP